MTDLIDTTEMYLRTIFELEEEGIVPLRARITELEERVAALEGGRVAPRPQTPSRSDLDPGKF